MPGKLSDQEYEQKKYDQKMIQILKELEQIESAFFIPINAHPLKKVNEAASSEAGNDASDAQKGGS